MSKKSNQKLKKEKKGKEKEEIKGKKEIKKKLNKIKIKKEEKEHTSFEFPCLNFTFNKALGESPLCEVIWNIQHQAAEDFREFLSETPRGAAGKEQCESLQLSQDTSPEPAALLSSKITGTGL